jgi:hypothetical protein
VSGAAPGSFWDAAVVHCPLLFVGGRAQLPAIGGVVTEIIRQFTAGRRAFAKRSRRLPACQTILNAIGNLVADGRQVEEFLFAEDICGFFGKLPTSPPRAEGNHPNPCLALRVRPLLMA